jgi:hypothetical protein
MQCADSGLLLLLQQELAQVSMASVLAQSCCCMGNILA